MQALTRDTLALRGLTTSPSVSDSPPNYNSAAGYAGLHDTANAASICRVCRLLVVAYPNPPGLSSSSLARSGRVCGLLD